MKFSVLAVLAAPILVTAQGYGAPPDSSAPASSAASSSAAPLPSAAPGQILVEVGKDGAFNFTPNAITAQQGDNVTFLFVQPAGFMHAVAQSSFAAPCTPLQGGFNSGLQGPGMQYTLTITNASQPIWIFCTQTAPVKHCGSGMVAGINIPASSPNSVAAFVAAASAIGNNEGPQTASPALSGVGAVATGPAAPTTAAAASASPSGGAGQLAVGTGSLMATLFALFALA